jgi:hypothetical protein
MHTYYLTLNSRSCTSYNAERALLVNAATPDEARALAVAVARPGTAGAWAEATVIQLDDGIGGVKFHIQRMPYQ